MGVSVGSVSLKTNTANYQDEDTIKRKEETKMKHEHSKQCCYNEGIVKGFEMVKEIIYASG